MSFLRMIARRVLIKGSCPIVLLIILTNPTFSSDAFHTTLQPVFQKYCIRCHGQDGEVNGEVNLQAISSESALSENSELLRELIDVIKFREMPPEGEAPLPETERRQLTSSLEVLLEQSVQRQQKIGHAPIRRMNRFQYNNAVVDLFQLDCVVFTLPERMMREHKNYFRPESGVMADTVTVGSRPLGKSQLIEPRLAGVAPFPQDLRAENGYDNRGDHLSLSPLLMESFLKLSQSITQSRDFTARRVGIWEEFFAAPSAWPRMSKAALRRMVRQRLEPFLTMAFRRPAENEVLDRYTAFTVAQIDDGLGFTDAMKAVAAATIASPRFLYLYEQASHAAATEPLSEMELASRLSFFLWGSIPDQELIQLAADQTLHDEAILTSQVERMLRDKKLKRFCDSFPAQWLQLERIISAIPDPERFPEFYFGKYRDSMHMMMEPLLLFETVLIENQPITKFIDSDFTYRSAVLQDAYGDELVTSAGMKKRPNAVTTLSFHRLPVTDRRHGGMITNAAVMTMTSGPEETKPITRGAWLATVIFNDPPDPPPADVPPLPDKSDAGEEELTLRERLSSHRERADCRGCHEQIDPLGFALENYNAIGGWRDKYENGREVDVAGVLFRKHPFHDVNGFKDAILAERDRFTTGFAGHLLSFAVARELDPADQIAIRKMAAATAADNYKIQTLIKQIVISGPFRQKKNPRHPGTRHVQN